MLGNATGGRGLYFGAVVGGVLGVYLAVRLARRFGWIKTPQIRGTLLGGIAGFGVAVPITLTNMSSPVVPVLSCALAGVGALLGAHWAGKQASSGSS